jgi:hypothetical protein
LTEAVDERTNKSLVINDCSDFNSYAIIEWESPGHISSGLIPLPQPDKKYMGNPCVRERTTPVMICYSKANLQNGYPVWLLCLNGLCKKKIMSSI